MILVITFKPNCLIYNILVIYYVNTFLVLTVRIENNVKLIFNTHFLFNLQIKIHWIIPLRDNLYES